jgi:hypothetical protein
MTMGGDVSVAVYDDSGVRTFEFGDVDDAVEYCYEQGWTDGLPFLLPTEKRVQAIIEHLGRDPNEVIGEIPPRRGVATIGRIAVNAAMAGCPPELVPIVIAAIQAMLVPKFNLNGVQTTTNICTPLLIVGGPRAESLGFNSSTGVLGGGSRANSSVGRAVRLVLWNVGGAKPAGLPGEISMSTFSQPARYSYCMPENLAASPWPGIHTSQDPELTDDDDAVTMFGCEGPHNVTDTMHDTGVGLLTSIAKALSAPGNLNVQTGGQALVALGPEMARVLGKEGWTREDVCLFLFEQVRLPLDDVLDIEPHRPLPTWWDPAQADKVWPPVFMEPSDVLVTVAGGAGPHSVVFPGWGRHGGYAVTRRIEWPDSATTGKELAS